MKDEAIKNRWRDYFDGLFNDMDVSTMPEVDDSFDDSTKRFVWRIQELEVKEAPKMMKGGKALGLDGVPNSV